MKKYIPVVGLTLATLLLVGGSSWAINQKNNHHQPLAPLPLCELLGDISSLGLTESQKSAAKGVLKKHLPEISATSHDLVAEHRKLRDLIRKEPANSEAIQKQAATLGQLVTKSALNRASIAQEILPILGDDQKAAIREIQAKMDARLDQKLEQVLKAIEG